MCDWSVVYSNGVNSGVEGIRIRITLTNPRMLSLNEKERERVASVLQIYLISRVEHITSRISILGLSRSLVYVLAAERKSFMEGITYRRFTLLREWSMTGMVESRYVACSSFLSCLS